MHSDLVGNYCRRTAYSTCCHDQQSWSALKVVICCTLQCELSTRDCKADSASRVAAALLLFLRLQHAAVPVMCQATVKAAVKDSKHFACCRQEVRAAKAAAKAEKATHEPPRLGKVKFEAEPVQVMMTTLPCLGLELESCSVSQQLSQSCRQIPVMRRACHM